VGVITDRYIESTAAQHRALRERPGIVGADLDEVASLILA
jgi:hypothetical protein